MAEKQLTSEFLGIDLTQISFTVVETIGGHPPDIEGLQYADQIPSLQDTFVSLRHGPGDGDLTEDMRAHYISMITPDTPAERSRIAEAQRNIDSALQSAKDDPDGAALYQIEARAYMPGRVPNVLNAEEVIVQGRIEDNCKARLIEYLRDAAGDPQTVLESALTRAYEGHRPPALPADPAELSRWQNELYRGIIDQITVHFGTAVHEALANNVMHGNKGDRHKLITIQHGYDPDSQSYIVKSSDQGEGFDPDGIRDPRAKESLEIAGGRGVLLMTKYLTELEYEDGGRTAIMRLDLPAAVEASATEQALDLHAEMRLLATKQLESAVADTSSGLIRSVSAHLTEQSTQALFETASADLDGTFQYPQDSAAQEGLLKELNDRVEQGAVTRLKRAALNQVAAVLRNEYRVDKEQPVTFEVGVAQGEAGPHFVIQVADSPAATTSEDMHACASCSFPGRQFSPPDERVATFSLENLGAAFSAGLFGRTPAEHITVDIGSLISEEIQSAAKAIAKREISRQQ